jgi:hypothetical protein
LDDRSIVAKISVALSKLEEQGELILTTAFPENVARFVLHSALEAWFVELGNMEEPIECTIPHLLEQTACEVETGFAVHKTRAKEIANAYFNVWLKTHSMREIAEIYWHETPREIAGRAYYHIEMGRPDNRDLEYLEWRKDRQVVSKVKR